VLTAGLGRSVRRVRRNRRSDSADRWTGTFGKKDEEEQEKR
jgi:hypothetical protein